MGGGGYVPGVGVRSVVLDLGKRKEDTAPSVQFPKHHYINGKSAVFPLIGAFRYVGEGLLLEERADGEDLPCFGIYISVD